MLARALRLLRDFTDGKEIKSFFTFIIQYQQKGYGKMEKYVCSICGYVYDPAAGDKEGNIPPGVPFDKLPDEWVCPICGAGKEEFNPD
jgi:rubredoxin